MAQWVKPLLGMLSSHFGVLVKSWLFCFGSGFLLMCTWEVAAYGSSPWVLVPHVGDLGRLPGSRHCFGPALVVGATSRWERTSRRKSPVAHLTASPVRYNAVIRAHVDVLGGGSVSVGFVGCGWSLLGAAIPGMKTSGFFRVSSEGAKPTGGAPLWAPSHPCLLPSVLTLRDTAEA